MQRVAAKIPRMNGNGLMAVLLLVLSWKPQSLKFVSIALRDEARRVASNIAKLSV